MNKSNFFSKKYARFVSSYPVQVLLVIFALLVFSMFSLSNFKLDASSDSLVLEGDDDLKYYRQINSDYASSDFLVVLFKPNEELFSKPVISVVRSLSDSLEGINGVSSVLSYLDAPLLFSPKMSITELADNLRTIEDDSIDLVLAKEEFRSSALYSELLSSKDAKITALQVSLDATPLYDEAVKERYEIIKLIEEASASDLILSQSLKVVNKKIQSLSDQETIKRDELIR